MKKLSLPMIVLLTACAMNAKTIEANCYNHSKFLKVSECINQELASVSTVPRNRSAYEQYGLFAKALAADVRKGKYSDEEAKLILSNQRINLEQADQEKLSNALSSMESNNNKSSFTNCHLTGNSVSCHSF